MTLIEVMAWVDSVDYRLDRLPIGLQVQEPVFLFRCNRCDFYLEEASRLWVPSGAPSDTYFIPALTAWNLGLHMGGHSVPAQYTPVRTAAKR